MGFQVNDGSPDLFDTLVRNRPTNEVLERINEIIDWRRVRKLLAKCYSNSKEGACGYDPVILAKMMLLESLYDLSDVKVSRECADRLSFRAFLGLDLDDSVPDDTTLVRFRNRLRGRKVLDKLNALILEMIEKQGLSVKGGAMIDASLVPAASSPPSPKKKEDEAEKKEDDSVTDNKSKTSENRYRTRDCEASWGGKLKKFVFGWKLHLSRDVETGLVRSHEVTTASTHDINVFEELLTGTETLVLADKAYGSEERRKMLKENGIVDGIMRKSVKGKDYLKEIFAPLNRLIGRYRAPVENTFANLKRWRGMSRARFLGLEKTKEQATWSIMAHNLMIAAKT